MTDGDALQKDGKTSLSNVNRLNLDARHDVDLPLIRPHASGFKVRVFFVIQSTVVSPVESYALDLNLNLVKNVKPLTGSYRITR